MSAASPTASLPRETASGCRERAEADLLACTAMITANQKQRLETSAASWMLRANMLQRVEDGSARRAREDADAKSQQRELRA